jgi:hypothetical protein
MLVQYIGANASKLKMPAVAHKLPPVPDLDGRRFCRHCDTTLPLASFPSGRRRYICRKHVWQCITKPSKLKGMHDARKKRLWMLWKRCWTDAKTVFKQSRVMIVQSDIDALLEDLELGVDGNDLLDNIAILPVDPTRLLCTDNARIVDKPARRQLVQACREGGAERYALELAVMG